MNKFYEKEFERSLTKSMKKNVGSSGKDMSF